MKKLVFGLIATFMVTSLSFGQIDPSKYGLYHNEIIKLYNEKYLGGDIKKLATTNIETMTKDMLELIKEKHPKEFENVTTQQLNNYFGFTTSIEDYDFFLNWERNKNVFVIKGYVSQKLSNLIDDIIANGKDYNSINNIITVFKSKNSLTDKEQKSLLVFESVLNESNIFWTQETNSLKKSKNPCTPRTIISDAGASFCTFYFGPAALLIGAASSLITYYSDPDC